ncbi:MAG TPA: DNA polymerase IV [Candidatus Dorea intestinavium]|nr:DNA polymerase IV [Candidatus Dorea intestinavium]
MERVIFHLDVNSAFLSWEAAYRIYHLGGRLDMRTIPAAISGNKDSRQGIILAKSSPAKTYGIKTGMTISDALKLCPHLYCAPPNYDLYQKCSKAFMNLLREYSDQVEPYSIDEAFVDMTKTWQLFGPSPFSVACQIKDHIYEVLGFTVNVGVSSNKLLAKMAGELKKPNHAETLFLPELKHKFWPLPVSKLFYVGRATTKKLAALGVSTIGELAQMDPLLLKQHLGKHGEIVGAFARGIDNSPVITKAPAQKGYGNSTTIAFDVTKKEEAKLVLLALCETTAARLRADQVKIEVLSVGIKTYDLNYQSHQMILPAPTNITSELYHFSCLLFDELWDLLPIRQLGIHTSRISDFRDARQLTLFDTTDYKKLETFDSTVDLIRRRFGADSLKRSAFLNSSIDHLSGGIAREKRSIDYTKEQID